MEGQWSAVRVIIGAVIFVVLLLVERARPLRRPTEPRARRVALNLALGAAGFGAVALVYGRSVLPVVELARVQGWGVARWLPGPVWAQTVVSIVLLDYTLWVWHWLNHKMPFLWRFHSVHHVDLDLDVSTAFRFHFGELLLSVPFRVLQVLFIGVNLGPLMLWETMLLVATEFHHANLRLPLWLDSAIQQVFVTPRMHGIHHSIVPREVNSNFGTLLTVWDRLHRTFVRDVPQEWIVIGVPGLRAPIRFIAALAIPFQRVSR